MVGLGSKKRCVKTRLDNDNHSRFNSQHNWRDMYIWQIDKNPHSDNELYIHMNSGNDEKNDCGCKHGKVNQNNALVYQNHNLFGSKT